MPGRSSQNGYAVNQEIHGHEIAKREWIDGPVILAVVIAAVAAAAIGVTMFAISFYALA